MRGDFELFALNRGIVAREALARLDLKRLAWAAEEKVNWEPMAVGPMRLRPGYGYLGQVAAAATRMIPFVFAIDDTAGVEVTASGIRVWIDDVLLARSAVTTSITNGGFDANVGSWTDQDEVGATSAWQTGGYLGLTGDGTNSAIREQQVTVAGANIGQPHALRIVIARGPVTLRIGSASLGSQYRRDTVLGTGTHSIVIVPTGDFFLQFHNANKRIALVDSVSIEAAGTMSLPSPYAEADLGYIRYKQSGDVIYIACRGYQQRKIERRSNGSWSIVLYQPTDGPFRSENVGPTTIAASALSGNVTLTASKALFDSLHVGALWTITSVGQRVEESISAENVFSDAIRVIGIGESRRFSVTVAGTFVATVTLQRSFDEGATWEDVGTYTAPASETPASDGFDNQIVHYRIGVDTGDYTSGTADVALNYSPGSRRGVVRLTAVASDVSASAEVITDLGGTAASSTWAEGLWSSFRGWPSGDEIHDGRLWWAGKDRFVGSVTDGFESFDPDYEGDAGPILRSIGFGPVDNINWLLSLGRLMAGTDMHELSCRSSSFDEPLTAGNFTPKKAGTQGSATVEAIEVDGRGIFVQRSGQALYELAYSIETQDYGERELTRLVPGLLDAGVTRIAVQRKPETIIHCVLADGTAAKLLYDPSEELLCWYKMETHGLIKDVLTLPDTEEDAVYYVVSRTINGSTVTYFERQAKLSESRGGAISKLADSFVYAAGPASTVSGLGHLEGESVVVWANGVDLGAFTVSGGQITLAAAASNIVVGLGYEARFKGAKLGYVVPQGKSAFGAKKRVQQLGLVLQDTHSAGIEFGPDFTTMDTLPLRRDGELVTEGVFSEYDEEMVSFPGVFDTDARVCLRATAPRPCMVKALVVRMETN